MTNFELKDPLEMGLQEGEMTKVTPEIRELTAKIGGEGLLFLENTALYLAEHYGTPKNLPDRMKGTAHDILFPSKIPLEQKEGLEEGKLPIGTCTEHGKALRTLCLAKGIPCIYVEAINERWIRVEDKEMEDPDAYDDHVFLEVYVNGKWFILNSTGRPSYGWNWMREKDLPEGKTIPPPYSLVKQGGRTDRYRIFARGVDHTQIWAEDGTEYSFHTKQEAHKAVNHAFPERIAKLASSPKDY